MKFIVKQKFFKFFDTFDITDEFGNPYYTVQNDNIIGHSFTISNKDNSVRFRVEQKLLTFLPKFEIYYNDQLVGHISSCISFFTRKLEIDLYGLTVEGDFWGFDYDITTKDNVKIAQISKALFNFTDTYSVEVLDYRYNILTLLICLVIDAINCR